MGGKGLKKRRRTDLTLRESRAAFSSCIDERGLVVYVSCGSCGLDQFFHLRG